MFPGLCEEENAAQADLGVGGEIFFKNIFQKSVSNLNAAPTDVQVLLLDADLVKDGGT